ncbi:MAG: hypothetical protein FWD71_10475 [Oscillospiraceae bacterium]|nr:hypothetical protein [Oscillospiraceae bacterium]
MKKVIIDAGICGFTTTVEAVSEDGMEATIHIQSDCDAIMKMAIELRNEVDAYEICLGKVSTGPVYETARNSCHHAACPVPAGIIKCIEAECKLALPKDAHIRFIDDQLINN